MRVNMSSFFIWVAITLSFFSYDSIIYSRYYTIFTGLVMCAGILAVIFGFQKVERVDYSYFKKNILTIVIMFTLLFSSFFSSMITGNITISDIISAISTGLSIIVFFVLVPNKIKNIKRLYKYILFLISCTSIIAILMQNFNLSFGHVQSEPTRMASIFFDANYFGSICVIGILITYLLIENIEMKAVLIFINILALYYSNSRGATLALVGSIVGYFLLVKKKNIKTLFAFLLFVVGLIAALILLEKNNFFRVYQGLNSRDFLWEIAFNLISAHPLVGYGKSSIDILLKRAGALNGSTHNSWLDFTISYGIINLSIYLLIIIKAFIRGIKKNEKQLVLIVLFFVINSNSINISLGGVGFNSLIFTITLGLINTKDKNISF